MLLLGLSFHDVLLLVSVPLVGIAHYKWYAAVQQLVPEPYLDEAFHIPQANAYFKGNWTHWDNKITTPPGIYLYSIVASKVESIFHPDVDPSGTNLRWTNFALSYLLVLVCTIWRRTASSSIPRRGSIITQEIYILAFPLLFFFSALYYTDIFAAFTVMCTYVVWQVGTKKKRKSKIWLQILQVLLGTISLMARQTNIFWSAVFLGGLQLIQTIKLTTRIHDPPVADTYFEDIPLTIISLLSSTLEDLPRLLLDLWPQLALLAEFAAFVVWNGGVVLGDKSHHVAGIHLAQLLYLWPFLLFFSWPTTVPQLAHFSQLNHRRPRMWLALVALSIMFGIVHFNTVIHPFILADNRHYTFYVFKLLRSRTWLWYAGVPFYAMSAWLSVQALGSKLSFSGGPGVKASKKRRLSTSSGPGDVVKLEADSNRISFVLVWFVSTALSLVSAPLIEPRYFLIPWLIWRLHVPDASDVLRDSEEVASSEIHLNHRIERLTVALARNSVLIEIAWYMTVNFLTCRLFLYEGFEWRHEPGIIQRFMW